MKDYENIYEMGLKDVLNSYAYVSIPVDGTGMKRSSDKATLDGQFTVEELRRIADALESAIREVPMTIIEHGVYAPEFANATLVDRTMFPEPIQIQPGVKLNTKNG